MELYQFIVFLHVIGAVGLGYYLLMPLLLGRAKSMSGSGLETYLSNLYVPCRIMQYLLIAQFLTGGYMISQRNYTTLWMTLVIVVFVIAAALSGMLNAKVKRTVKNLKSGADGQGALASANMYSWLSFVSLLAVIYLMMYPSFG